MFRPPDTRRFCKQIPLHFASFFGGELSLMVWAEMSLNCHFSLLNAIRLAATYSSENMAHGQATFGFE